MICIIYVGQHLLKNAVFKCKELKEGTFCGSLEESSDTYLRSVTLMNCELCKIRISSQVTTMTLKTNRVYLKKMPQEA